MNQALGIPCRFRSFEFTLSRFPLLHRVIAGLRVEHMVIARPRRLLHAADDECRQGREAMVPAGSAHLSHRSEQPLVVPGDVVVGRVEGRQLLDEFAIRDKRVFETGLPFPQVITDKGLGETPPALVPSVVPSVPKDGSELILEPSFGGVNDLDLSEVVRVWRDLPEHIKQTILTLTRAVRK